MVNRLKQVGFTAKKIDYLLVFLFIAISGNPFFCYWNLASAMLLVLFLLRIQNKNQDSSSLSSMIFQIRPYLIGFSLIFILQLLFCKDINVLVQINYLIKITLGGLVYQYYKDKFRYYYLNVMTVVALVSIILYPMVITGLSLPNIFGLGFSKSTTLHTILIYNYNVEFNFERNAGMFWEPGCFACYLCLVPLLYIDNLKQFIKNNKIKCIILLLALISTQSTTGYLVSCILLFIAFSRTYKLFGPIMGALIILSLITSAVVTDKLSKDFATIEYMKLGEMYEYDGYNTENRLGTIFFLFPIFLLHPIIGNGINLEAMFASVPYVLTFDNIGLGNGFMTYLVQVGLLGVFVYSYSLYKKWQISSLDKSISLFIIFLLLQGEPLLMYPVFIGLPFYYVKYNK